MTVALLVLVGISVALSAFVALRVRRTAPPTANAAPRPVPTTVPELLPDPGPIVVHEQTSTAGGPLGLELLDDRSEAVLVRLEEVESPGRVDNHAPAPWMGAMIETLAQQFPQVRRLLRESNSLRVTFSNKTLRGLATGNLHLVPRASGAMPVVADSTGRFVEIGAVVGGLGAAAVGWPAVLLAGGAMAAAYAQQQWLDQTFRALERGMTTVIERLQDTEHGRVEGAYAFVEVFDRAISDGLIPVQYRRELAVARRDVDAVYFSRRRYLDRVIDRVNTAQGPTLSSYQEPPKLTKEILEAFGSGPEVFEAEVVLYLRALVVRARLTSTTATLLAIDGFGDQALDLANRVGSALHKDFFELFRRISGLARHDLGRIPWRGKKELKEVVTGLRGLMDGLEPLARHEPAADEPTVLLHEQPDGAWVLEPAQAA